ncbi:MAG: hypothetical protein ACLGHP_12880, partial [Vicinamibacteria bacterium]
ARTYAMHFAQERVALDLHRVFNRFGEVEAALRVIHHAHALRPDLPVVVRASDEADMEKLAQAGAAVMVQYLASGAKARAILDELATP